MEEKQRILKLLKDQVITVEEANVLLDALTKEEKPNSEKRESKEPFYSFEQKLEKFGDDVGKLIKESLKIVEEKVDKIFKSEAEKN